MKDVTDYLQEIIEFVDSVQELVNYNDTLKNELNYARDVGQIKVAENDALSNKINELKKENHALQRFIENNVSEEKKKLIFNN